ncbi:MAG TPA: outer membrane beta-barrel protein [Actinomycetota bacterium]|nr:outer membrane beta-barrel protein [Actinomycetota bacterium]
MKRMALVLAILTCTVASTETQAQANLGLKRIGAAAGFVSPENLDGTFSIGAFADMGTLTPKIGLEPRLDFWSWSNESFGAKSTVSDVTLGARGKYFFEVANSRIRPFAGAGLGLHFLHAKVDIPAQGGSPAVTAEDSQTKLGLDLGGGLATPLSPRTDFHAEVWYGIVSDVNQFALRVGVSQKIGQ